MSDREFLPFESDLAAAWPPEHWRDVTLLVAVSGGADSVALLRGLSALRRQFGGPGKLVVGHFDHRLRPESAGDAVFVGQLAGQLDLPLERAAGDVPALAHQQGNGVEAAARDARYAFLLDAAHRIGARYIATAHTVDDQIETVLFNLLRGTGLAGLAGIPRARPLSPAVSLIRPLLNTRRQQVIEYLQAIGQPYHSDASNDCVEFTRNRIRRELLPLLRREYNATVDSSIERLSRLAGDAQQIIERMADELLDRCLIRSDSAESGEVRLDTTPLTASDPHLVREVFVALWRRTGWSLQAMRFADWDFLATLAADLAAPSKRHLPGNILVERHGEHLVTISNRQSQI